MTRKQEREVIIGFIQSKIIMANKLALSSKTNKDRAKYGAIVHEMHLLKISIQALYKTAI
jgi:hypothetical protein